MSMKTTILGKGHMVHPVTGLVVRKNTVLRFPFRRVQANSRYQRAILSRVAPALRLCRL